MPVPEARHPPAERLVVHRLLADKLAVHRVRLVHVGLVLVVPVCLFEAVGGKPLDVVALRAPHVAHAVDRHGMRQPAAVVHDLPQGGEQHVQYAALFLLRSKLALEVWVLPASVELDGKVDDDKAPEHRVAVLANVRQAVAREYELCLVAQDEYRLPLVLGHYGLAGHQRLYHPKVDDLVARYVGVDVHHLALELGPGEPLLDQLVDGHVRYVALAEHLRYDLQQRRLAVVPLSEEHYDLFEVDLVSDQRSRDHLHEGLAVLPVRYDLLEEFFEPLRRGAGVVLGVQLHARQVVRVVRAEHHAVEPQQAVAHVDDPGHGIEPFPLDDRGGPYSVEYLGAHVGRAVLHLLFGEYPYEHLAVVPVHAVLPVQDGLRVPQGRELLVGEYLPRIVRVGLLPAVLGVRLPVLLL